MIWRWPYTQQLQWRRNLVQRHSRAPLRNRRHLPPSLARRRELGHLHQRRRSLEFRHGEKGPETHLHGAKLCDRNHGRRERGQCADSLEDAPDGESAWSGAWGARRVRWCGLFLVHWLYHHFWVKIRRRSGRFWRGGESDQIQGRNVPICGYLSRRNQSDVHKSSLLRGRNSRKKRLVNGIVENLLIRRLPTTSLRTGTPVETKFLAVESPARDIYRVHRQ